MSSAQSLIRKSLPDAPKEPTALERLENLEGLTTELVKQGNQTVRDNENHNRLIEALIELLGAEPVAKKMVEIHQRKLEQQADDQEATFAQAVEQGHLARVEASQKTDIVVAVQQKNVEGTILHPTRVFGPVAAFPPETQKLLGFDDGKLSAELKVGQVIEMGPAPKAPEGSPSRGTLIVLAIYEPVVKAEEPAAEVPAIGTPAEAAPEEAPTVDTSEAPALPQAQAEE